MRYKQALDRYCAEHGIRRRRRAGGVLRHAGRSTATTFTESNSTGSPSPRPPEQFDTDEWQILVVAEKFQTGFDQPKLYAMYVDKTLSGLAAVQTLSRLNRIAPATRTGTFVLDFRNDADDIQDAFEPYYAQTVAPPTDPNLLYDTHAELDQFDVLATTRSRRSSRLLLEDPADEPRPHPRRALSPRSTGSTALDDDEQDEFRDVLSRFVRIYCVPVPGRVVRRHQARTRLPVLPCARPGSSPDRPARGSTSATRSNSPTTPSRRPSTATHPSTSTAARSPPCSAAPARLRDPDEMPLSEIIARINERFGTEHLRHRPAVHRPDRRRPRRRRTHPDRGRRQRRDLLRGRLRQHLDQRAHRPDVSNEKFAFELLDNDELRAALVAEYLPDIYKRARVARQRTCPIGDLIGPDREDAHLEYKSTLRWDIREGDEGELPRGRRREDRSPGSPTPATAAPSSSASPTTAPSTDSKTTTPPSPSAANEATATCGRPHLTNLLRRLGDAAATLVEWEFLTINGDDIARINVEPSDHPVYDTKGGEQVFYWRYQERTTAIADDVERDRIIARRWPA